MNDLRSPQLHSFHGGLRLDGKKTVAAAILTCPLPQALRVPLSQYGVIAATACVTVGEQVERGQRIAVGPTNGVPIFAPASGVVDAIAVSPEPSISITCDECQPPARTLPAMAPWLTDPADILQRLRDAGVVGLGGAGFPTWGKMQAQPQMLILNGAECEPYIACDDALLREFSSDVVQGARLLGRACGASVIVLAIEDTMRDAINACESAIARDGAGQVELVIVPTLYPEGGERQLIEVLTGREVPADGLPRDIGVVVHNVATAAAAWRAVVQGQVMTSRIVTVAGPGVVASGNYDVAFGTSVAHLVAQAGGYTEQAERLLLGGPMMGLALPDDSASIGATNNCVLVLGAADLRNLANALPCIRCGDCATACPARLQPQQLLRNAEAGNFDKLNEEGLFACIECGCCDLACPSQIPLTEQFRIAKTGVRNEQRRRTTALAAGARFEQRAVRLERLLIERAARDAERAVSASSGDAVAAAIERAKAKRLQGRDRPE